MKISRTSAAFFAGALAYAVWVDSGFAFRADESVARAVSVPPGRAADRAPSADQVKKAGEAENEGVAVRWSARQGAPLSVRGKDLGKRRGFSGGKGLLQGVGTAYGPNAIAVLDNLSGLYRMRDASKEFAVKRIEQDGLRFHHVRAPQMYEGLRVVGGELMVHFDRGNQAYEVNGRYVPDLNVSVTPNIQAGDAVRAAQQDLAGMGATQVLLEPGAELVVFALNQNPALAYELVFTFVDPLKPSARWRYWVDAVTGKILLRYNDIKKIAAPTANGAGATITGNILAGEGGGLTSVTGWRENNGIHYLYNKVRYWYVYNVAASGYADNNTYAYRNTASWSASDRSEMLAAAAFDDVQNYYRTVHGRNSFNNANAYARANVHEGSSYVNAYWDGTDFHFGDGDGVTASSLVVLDVAGHEYTHAVTEYTANLYYYSESGALNESFSDILGAAIEFDAQPDGRVLYPNKTAGYADWLLGEDCWIETKSLRDMRNPSNPLTVGYGNEQPSRYHGTYWYSGSGDNGGVHINSGVQNFMFYLLSEGGSGNNDGTNYNVVGIGVSNAAKVAYRALTVYCGEYTDHSGARSAWISAAQDLNAAWVASAQAAWDAVGVGAGSSTGDEWDPGDNGGSGATELATPTSLEQSHGPHTLSSSDSYDWFKVYLNAGVTYNLNTVGGTGDLYGELYSDPSGNNRVAFDDDSGGAGGPFIIAYTNTSSAWYYLRVRTYTTGQSASYTLKYRVTGGGQPSTDIATALDTTLLSWITGGSSSWAGESTDTHDGVDAARSGAIGDSQSTWVETTVQGPGSISFWWKVSSESSYDFLTFFVDGAMKKEISGTVAWRGETFSLPAGAHTLTWIYEKDISVSGGSDAGWLDQVTWSTNAGGSAVNDYNGDGLSDLAVHDPSSARWYVRQMSGAILAYATNWGGSGAVPVVGDYDGDGRFDLAAFQKTSGRWYIRSLTAGAVANGAGWGFSTAIPVEGDYNGDGTSDLAVFDPARGDWYIRTLSGTVLAYGLNWGFSGAVPVAGDYNGDGISDLAVFDPARGNWYIRTMAGAVLAYGLNWGFGGVTPVMGDFNADGIADLAVYDAPRGNWYIRTLGGPVLAYGLNWGFSGCTPLSGDYDGDGEHDLAVYHQPSGLWYIRGLDHAIASGTGWGYGAASPVKP